MALFPSCVLCILMLASVFSMSLTIKNETLVKSDFEPKNILAILPLPTQSHQNIFCALITALVNRGHYVTLVTPRAQKAQHPRLRQILIEDPVGKVFSSADVSREYFEGSKNILERALLTFLLGPTFNAVVLEDPKVLALKQDHFDLVITETLIHQEPLLGFAHHFGCPSLNLNPLGYSHHLNDVTGGAINPAYVTNVFGTSKQPETFYERLANTVTSVPIMLFYHLYYLPKADRQMRAVFPDAPPIEELIQNISLTFVTNNNALMHAVPLAPSVIEVAGIHIKPGSETLPAELKKWMDESPEGVVYFSLGSNLKANLLPDHKREAILESFGKLKERVLLKWNGAIPANAPRNCRFEDWLPQQEVLAHPNLKVFVSHGGLLSTQEAVYFGVPMIGMPVLGDQFMNMELAMERGFALKVSIYELTSQILDAALDQVISNPKYRIRSKEVSVQFRLDPVPALEKAVYYTEQLMKLGCFSHLQPKSLLLHWYQYLLLDVAVAIVAIIVLALFLLSRIATFLYSVFSNSSKNKKD